MKKLFSVVVLAMVALVATTFISCGDDSDDSNKTFTFNVTFSEEVTSSEVQNAIVSFFKSAAGSDATFSSATSKGFTITGNGSNKATILSKIQSADASQLDKTLDNLFCIKTVTLNAYDESEKFAFSYRYVISTQKLIQGTYTATVDGKSFKLEVKDAIDDNFSNAVCTVGGTETYDGKVDKVSQFKFISNDLTGTESTVVIDPRKSPFDAFSDDLKSFTAYEVVYKGATYSNITFTRQ